jgi:hypothetical protein
MCVARTRRKPASSIDCASVEWDSGGVACMHPPLYMQCNGPRSKHTACEMDSRSFFLARVESYAPSYDLYLLNLSKRKNF